MATLAKPPVFFLPECHVDTAVLLHLRWRDDAYSHRLGNTEVANYMLARPAQLLIGMVDDDDARRIDKGSQRRREPLYFRTFVAHTGFADGEQVRFLQHSTRPHYLIKVRPQCEQWLLGCAQRAGLSLVGLGFAAETTEAIIQRAKNQRGTRHPAITGLLKALRRAEEPDFLRIHAFIRHYEPDPDWAQTPY